MHDPVTRFLLLVLVVTAVGFFPAAVSYARREPEVRARWWPAGLRLASLGLLLLLLVNPGLPGEDPVTRTAGEIRHWVVVEVHPVMVARSSEAAASLGEVTWEDIRARYGSADGTSFPPGTGTLAVFGDGPERLRRLDAGDVDPLRPGSPTPRPPPGEPLPPDPGEAGTGPSPEALARVLLRLAEAGADSITLVSPLRGPLEPLEEAIRELASLPVPVPVRLHRTADNLRNAGVVDLEVPASLRPGDPLEGAVVLSGEGGVGPGDSVRVEVRVGERAAFEAWVPLPEVGDRVRVPFRVTVPGPEGWDATEFVDVIATVALPGDAYGLDDEMRRRIRRGEPAGGILLLSVRPDGEPRSLLPLLERATGLEGEGWILAGPSRFVALGQGGEGLRLATAGDLVHEIPRARLLVVQGDAEDLPPDWIPALRAHPRRILLASSGSAGRGEWSVDPAVPLSPLSGHLSGVLPPGAAARLPPLGLPVQGWMAAIPEATAMDSRVALQLRDPGGQLRPGVVLGEASGVREARVPATGLWRWAGREGAGGSFYRSLWGGVAAWILSPDVRASPGLPGSPGGPLAPVVGEGGEPGAMSRVPAPPGELADREGEEEAAAPREEGPFRARPLRTHPLPWLLLVGLLGAEWILRRRMGLR
jgi:hypothetical protein